MKKTVIDIIRENVLVDRRFDMYELPNIVVNWPQVVSSYGEDEEELDVESWEILSLDEDRMIICAGGDWQQPLTLTIELFNDELLQVVNSENGYEEGLSNEEILKILSK
jgi:hypothetical protein